MLKDQDNKCIHTHHTIRFSATWMDLEIIILSEVSQSNII